MSATIAILGTFDTKGTEHALVAELLQKDGFATLLIDVGSKSEPTVTPDVSRDPAFAQLYADTLLDYLP